MSAALRRGAPVLLASLSLACAVRDPLDSASASMTAGETEGMSSSGGAEATSASASATDTTAASATTVAPTTGTATTGDPTTEDVPPDGPLGAGQFLFALSTVIAPDLPLQFIADNEWGGDGSDTWLRSVMQPLAVGQGQVTTPRTPVGEPLVLEMIFVTDGAFQVDVGSVSLPGAANPITGGDITATLSLRGTFLSPDFYCGEVNGEVTAPLNASITGSTFAAIRVDNLESLPLAVPINCEGETVTDQ